MRIEVALGAIGAMASLSAGIAKTSAVHRESTRNGADFVTVQRTKIDIPSARAPEHRSGSESQEADSKFGSASV
jgi:hypothetical protein